jgi:HK97 family phage major capsid protein
MRRGPIGLNAQQRELFDKRFQEIQAAQGTVPDTAGGYTVGQDNSFMAQIEDAQKAYGGMLETAYVFSTSGGQPLPIPTDNDTTNSGTIVGENPATAATQDITFGSVTFNGYTFTSKLVLVSNQLLQDSAFDLNGWLAGKLGTRIARAVNTYCTVGTGASQPTGVVTGATLGYTNGGSTTSGETTSILTDDLIELEHSVDPAYRRNARYMMADAALKTIKKLKDAVGRPLWLPGLAVKEPDTINGYPYTINQDMAVPAASAKSMLFGDFSKYFIRRIVGTQMLRLTERYAELNQVGFIAFQRWDGQLVDAGTHPIKYLQQSAS